VSSKCGLFRAISITYDLSQAAHIRHLHIERHPWRHGQTEAITGVWFIITYFSFNLIVVSYFTTFFKHGTGGGHTLPVKKTNLEDFKATSETYCHTLCHCSQLLHSKGRHSSGHHKIQKEHWTPQQPFHSDSLG